MNTEGGRIGRVEKKQTIEACYMNLQSKMLIAYLADICWVSRYTG